MRRAARSAFQSFFSEQHHSCLLYTSMRRNEGIRKAADWVIEHSTIEEK